MGEDPRIERTRRKVARAALSLLEEGGPEALTHQRVAERSGLSRPTIYRHWPRRTQLILAAMESRPRRDYGPEDAPIRDRLVRRLGVLWEELGSPLSVTFLSLVAKAEWDDEIRAALDRRLAGAVEDFGAILEEGVRRGEIRAGLPLETAHAQLVGPLFFERILGGRSFAREAIPAHVDALLESWRPRRPPEAGP